MFSFDPTSPEAEIILTVKTDNMTHDGLMNINYLD